MSLEKEIEKTISRKTHYLFFLIAVVLIFMGGEKMYQCLNYEEIFLPNGEIYEFILVAVQGLLFFGISALSIIIGFLTYMNNLILGSAMLNNLTLSEIKISQNFPGK